MHISPKATLCIFLGFLFSPLSVAQADGGAIRLSKVVNGYRITIFTAPTPFLAGIVDISVLVQDADSAKPIPEARVTVKMTPDGRPHETITQTATAEAATNKLLQAAVFELPQAGWWELEVAVEGPTGRAIAQCRVEAGEPWPPWLTLLPWVAWPAVPIVLFVVHLVLVKRRTVAQRASR
jgi:hypothetical protein